MCNRKRGRQPCQHQASAQRKEKRRGEKTRRENNVPEFLTISLNLDKLSNCPQGEKRKREREREREEAFTFVVSALAFEHIQTERGTPVFLVNLLANPLTGYLVRRRLKQLVLVLVLVAWFPWAGRSPLALPLPLPQRVPP